MPLLREIASTALQLLLFTLIPFLFFLFRKDKSVSFTRYIGLYAPTGASIVYVIGASLLFVATGIGLTFIDTGIKQAVLSPSSVTGGLRQMGFNAMSVSILLIIANVKTSLAEEILFRGFIAKRLIALSGFTVGNILQSLLFGVVHLLLFWALTQTTAIPLAIIFVFSSIAGWTIGYIKENNAHGVGSTIPYFVYAFVM